MPPHLLALVVVLGLILGDAAASLTNGAQAHIQFRWTSESVSPEPALERDQWVGVVGVSCGASAGVREDEGLFVFNAPAVKPGRVTQA